MYASKADTDLRRAALLIPLRIEEGAYQREEGKGRTTWPEFGMLVGADDSTVVLDKLHVRNVVPKHIRIVYGGGQVILENVTFIDCTFDLIRTQRTVELSDVLLKEQVIDFGI